LQVLTEIEIVFEKLLFAGDDIFPRSVRKAQDVLSDCRSLLFQAIARLTAARSASSALDARSIVVPPARVSSTVAA
jgi:hypothetical protein